jgi:hypothetical protein
MSEPESVGRWFTFGLERSVNGMLAFIARRAERSEHVGCGIAFFFYKRRDIEAAGLTRSPSPMPGLVMKWSSLLET